MIQFTGIIYFIVSDFINLLISSRNFLNNSKIFGQYLKGYNINY